MIADMDQEGKQQLLFSRQRQSEGTSKSVRQQSLIVNVGVRLHKPRFQLVTYIISGMSQFGVARAWKGQWECSMPR